MLFWSPETTVPHSFALDVRFDIGLEKAMFKYINPLRGSDYRLDGAYGILGNSGTAGIDVLCAVQSVTLVLMMA